MAQAAQNGLEGQVGADQRSIEIDDENVRGQRSCGLSERAGDRRPAPSRFAFLTDAIVRLAQIRLQSPKEWSSRICRHLCAPRRNLGSRIIRAPSFGTGNLYIKAGTIPVTSSEVPRVYPRLFLLGIFGSQYLRNAAVQIGLDKLNIQGKSRAKYARIAPWREDKILFGMRIGLWGVNWNRCVVRVGTAAKMEQIDPFLAGAALQMEPA